MKVATTAIQHYQFIEVQRFQEQSKIRHRQNLNNLEKMNQQTIEIAEAHRATQQLHSAQWDRVRQVKEAYLGQECLSKGHNETAYHVDIKV